MVQMTNKVLRIVLVVLIEYKTVRHEYLGIYLIVVTYIDTSALPDMYALALWRADVCIHQMNAHLSDLLCCITFVALFFVRS